MAGPPTLVSIARGVAAPRSTPAVEFESAACPLCGADDAEALFLGRDHLFGFAGEFPVVRCRRCGMRYNQPRVRPADVTHFFDADYAAHAPDYAARPARRGRDPWDAVPPFGQSRHLDVGCGAGALLERLGAQGWRGFGVDPVAAAVASCRRRGVDAVMGTIPGVDLGERRFELITLLGAVGTLSAPRETFAVLRRHITPDGLLILNAFNAESWFARLAGPLWPGYDLPRQCCHWTPATLDRLLDETGWRVANRRGRRRPNMGRRAARLAALSGRGGFWPFLASQRWATGLISTLAALAGAADDMAYTVRPV